MKKAEFLVDKLTQKKKKNWLRVEVDTSYLNLSKRYYLYSLNKIKVYALFNFR